MKAFSSATSLVWVTPAEPAPEEGSPLGGDPRKDTKGK